jgi:hypothetical protein
MLHIATVHYTSPRWVEIQTRYLREHISVPYRTWTSLERIDPAYGSHFDRVVEQVGRHSDKLNHLAIEIAHEASDSDLLMFLDGDAFPIADPMALIADALAKAPLLAVRRAENLNDQQPHPCFCVTTVGAWRSLPGDWSPGHMWVNSEGERVTDVGGNLLRQLEYTNTPWVPVLRSNRRNLDPVSYAVYGSVVYHHGAGFRPNQFTRTRAAMQPAFRSVPSTPVLRRLVMRDNWRKRRAWQRHTQDEMLRYSRQMHQKIEQGGSAWLAELM